MVKRGSCHRGLGHDASLQARHEGTLFALTKFLLI